MRRMPGAALLVAALALLVLTPAAALAGNGGIAPVPPHSPQANAIDDVYWLLIGITGAVFVIVEGALVLFIVRYRRGRRERGADAAQVHGHTRLEIGWTVVPVLIVAAIIGFVFAQLPDVQSVGAARAGETPLEIRVEGHQYYWLFRYPQGQVAIDTMVVPVDRPVRLTIVGEDVVHSWWVPALMGKTDAIPGRVNHQVFRASDIGTYTGQCAELCGMYHALMRQTVRVVTDAQYRQFLAAHADSSRTVAAEAFTGVCSTCHGFQGKGDYGPPLQNRSFQQSDMADVLRNGRGKMPPVGNTWTEAQIKGLVSYLQETKGGAQLGG